MAQNEIVLPESWDKSELTRAFGIAKRANIAAAKADASALSKTAVAYHGASTLGWFGTDKEAKENGTTMANFLEATGLSEVSGAMRNRYIAFGVAYVKGVTPDSPEDNVLRKSGVMSALAGKIKSEDVTEVTMDAIKELVVAGAPNNEALRNVALSEFGVTVEKESSNTDGDAGVNLGTVLTDFAKLTATLVEHKDVLTTDHLAKLDKSLAKLAKLRESLAKAGHEAAA